MLLVERDRVGVAAFARLARERVIHEVLGSRALPADIVSSRALRAHMIAPLVPPHAWLTGLAALWLEGWAGAPGVIDLAGPRGMHRTEAGPGSPPLRFHSGRMSGLSRDQPWPRTATPSRACLDALAHSPAALALPATASALRDGGTTVPELASELSQVDRRTAHRARVAGLVRLLGEL